MFLGGGPPCPENPWFMCWVWQEIIRNDHWDGYHHYPGSCQSELPAWQSDSTYWSKLDLLIQNIQLRSLPSVHTCQEIKMGK